jgi:hypothetical protein
MTYCILGRKEFTTREIVRFRWLVFPSELARAYKLIGTTGEGYLYLQTSFIAVRSYQSRSRVPQRDSHLATHHFLLGPFEHKEPYK